METRCHLGQVIRYDTVSKSKWSVDVRTHGIAVIIEKLLAEDWDEEGSSQGGVPPFYDESDCVVSSSSTIHNISVLKTLTGLFRLAVRRI